MYVNNFKHTTKMPLQTSAPLWMCMTLNFRSQEPTFQDVNASQQSACISALSCLAEVAGRRPRSRVGLYRDNSI